LKYSSSAIAGEQCLKIDQKSAKKILFGTLSGTSYETIFCYYKAEYWKGSLSRTAPPL